MTMYDSAHAWFYKLGKDGQFVNRDKDRENSRAISMHCLHFSDSAFQTPKTLTFILFLEPPYS